MTKLWWKIHGWCGVYCGGFLAFVLITGGLAMLAPPLERWENGRAASFAPTAFDPSNLGGWTGDALAKLGDPDLNGISLPAKDSEPLRLEISNPNTPESDFRPNAPWRAKSVFLHPATGEILGELDDDRRFSVFLATVHIRLFAGTPGRNFVGIFGLALLINALTGLFLLGKFLRKKSLWIIRKKSARLATADLHMLGGTLLLLPAMLFAITGFWLGWQGRIMDWTGIERPGIHQRAAVMAKDSDTTFPVDYAAVLSAAQAAYPGLIVQRISPSGDGQGSIILSGRTGIMLYERLSQTVVLDKRDLSVLDVHQTSKAGWRDKLFFLQEGLHFGEFAGWAGRITYLIIGMLLGLLPISGYLIRRLRKKQSLRPIYAWVGFSAAYLVVSLFAVKTQGIYFTMAWCSVVLWVFVAGLVLAAVGSNVLRTRE